MIEYAKPLPQPTAETKPFWEGCRRHELLIPKCPACGARWFPPAALCPECWNEHPIAEPVNGRGTVYSYAIYHRLYHPAFKEDIPYLVAIIELDEGPRMMSNLIGCAPEQARVGMPVEVVFEDVTGEVTLYKFRPVAAS